MLCHSGSSLNQVGQNDIVASSNGDSKLDKSAMASVLSLDDGSWSSQADNLSLPFCDPNDNFPLVRQPSPPPVLAQVQPEYMPISPSKVADPRPGPAKSLTDGTPSSDTYQHLHIVSCFCWFHFSTHTFPRPVEGYKSPLEQREKGEFLTPLHDYV